MLAANRTKQIQSQVDRAIDAADQASWFLAEAQWLKALIASRGRSDWSGMIQIVEGLRSARRAIRRKALVRGSVRVVDDAISETMELTAGRYLLQPPLVGADARRLIQFGREQEVPIAVICREPRTQTGLIPIVAIAPGTTIRARIDPPSKESQPSVAWFKTALDSIGEAALDRIDPADGQERRIDALLGCLDAIPDYDPVYARLIGTLEEATRSQN